MHSSTPDPLPLACVPGAIPAEERPAHFALVRRLFGQAARSREALPDGYVFLFSASELEAVQRFVLHERKCCPFLSFEVHVSPGDGPVRLRLAGPAGTVEFLQDALSH